MNWTQIMEILAKHWIEQLCVIVIGILTWLYNKKLKKYANDQKAMRLGMLAQLRDRFYQSYKQIVKQGYYPIADREVMADIYDQYHALGGNGLIDNLKRELDGLPAYRQKEAEQDE